MSVQIVYETHGTTVDNEAGIATGWLPDELSPEGVRNAEDLGRRRAADQIDVVYSSDLARAVETARIAFADSGIPVRSDVRLRECNYGDLNGAPRQQLEPRTRFLTTPFPGGESYQDVVDRTAEFLTGLAREHQGQRVLLVAHAANRLALDVLLGGASLAAVVDEPFEWQEGWDYRLVRSWRP